MPSLTLQELCMSKANHVRVVTLIHEVRCFALFQTFMRLCVAFVMNLCLSKEEQLSAKRDIIRNKLSSILCQAQLEQLSAKVQQIYT